MTKRLRPDVIIMDIAMPQLNGVQATRQILEASPASKIVILSGHGDGEYVDHVIELGAVGYLVKDSSADMLARAIRAVHRGGTYFSPSVAADLRRVSEQATRPGGRTAKKRASLTSRETEVLRKIAEGNANKRIATGLAVSIKTVENHRQHLMAKLGLHDTAGLTRYAVSAGIIGSGVRLTIK
jgi:DNA-binding NarL/FixJ family response regulator